MIPDRVEELNEYLDDIVSESQKVTNHKIRKWEEAIQFHQGKQWQNALPKHRVAFTANYTNVSVKRLVALMTDTKPRIDIKSRAPGLSELTEHILTPAVRATWDEQNFDQKFSGSVLPLSIIMGACGVNVTFDPNIGSDGSIALGILDPRSIILDPAVRRTTDLDEAHYSGFRSVHALAKIRRWFSRNGEKVEADPELSAFYDRSMERHGPGVNSPAHKIGSTFVRAGKIISFAVPRAAVEEFYIKDYRLVKELPQPMQERAIARGLTVNDPAWPGGRRIVRAGANKVLLLDGANPFIDGRTPICMYDWGLETEHPWGASEVELIQSLQAILNKLGSSITENAIKMNNNIWIGDRDALEKKEWADLNDAPGLLVKVKPGRTLRRESPPALPGSVFQMIQWLVSVIDTLTGLVDVTQGRRPVGVVSSHAIEALNLSAQTLIRLQTRKFEHFLERIGQRLISRIFQFYSSDRLMHYLGQGNKWTAYHLEREKLTKGHNVQLGMKDGMMQSRPFDYMKDLSLLRFFVTPGSSMAISRLQKAQLSLVLVDRGLIPEADALYALEWEDPEGKLQKAREERMSGVTGAAAAQNKRMRVAA